MKRISLTLCLLVATCCMSLAQTKVVERSAKKAPEWVNTANPSALVVTVTANTIADAQVKAMAEVTERIILSVASNVSVSQRNESSEIVEDDNVQSRDEFTRLSKIKSANLPFLKGISSNKTAGIYWQRVQDKKTGKSYYEYSVLYPYSRREQRTLQAEFEALDQEMTAKYEALAQKIDNIESVEDIKAATTELNALKAYFFDDVRLEQVEGLKKRYLQLYDALTLTGKFVKRGQYSCQVLLKGRPVKVSTLPTVKSNSVTQLNVRPTTDGTFLVTYDDSECIEDEENTIDVMLRLEGKRLTYKISLTEAGSGFGSQKFSIAPEGKVLLTAAMVDAAEREVTDVTVRLTVNNRNGNKFAVKSFELNVPDIAVPLVFDNVDAIYSTKGLIQIKMLAQGEYSLRQVKKNDFGFVKGTLNVVNPDTGAIEPIKVALPYSTNWE